MGTSTSCYSALCRKTFTMYRHACYVTELCITKGQEGTVAGWQSYVGPHGKLVLDTLFVRLTNPLHMVKFDDLPEN
jgi:hypothetical protein